MKLREVACEVQGTSLVENFTHPDPVCIGVPSLGVGSWGTFRKGGVKITEIKSPTKNPTNNQMTENILLY